MGKKQAREISRRTREISELKAEIRVLRRLLGRDNPREMVESVLSGITPLVLGYRDAAKTDKPRLNELLTSMGSQGLDETAGVERGVWFPDVEFDESMEAPERWPERGTISSSPNSTIMPQHKINRNGVERTDGQAMFTVGTTGPPPESETE